VYDDDDDDDDADESQAPDIFTSAWLLKLAIILLLAQSKIPLQVGAIHKANDL
jgi:hypothetical protein